MPRDRRDNRARKAVQGRSGLPIEEVSHDPQTRSSSLSGLSCQPMGLPVLVW
jgi:hypothetical protein